MFTKHFTNPIEYENATLQDKINRSHIEHKENLQKYVRNLNQCKYKEVLFAMEKKGTNFKYKDGTWVFNELKLICVFKIVNRKLNKHAKEQQKLKRIDKYLYQAISYIHEWSMDLNKSDVDYQIQKDMIIRFNLQLIYTQALMCYNSQQIADTIVMLSIGKRLIDYFCETCQNADALAYMQKILIFLSTFLILDNNYQTAKIYLSNSLKISIKELSIRLEGDTEFDVKTLPKKPYRKLEKVFLNIVIGFYQRGVCEENLGNLLLTIENYRQAKWFGENFLQLNFGKSLNKFISSIEKKAMNYYKWFEELRNTNYISEIKLVEKQKEYAEINLDAKNFNYAKRYASIACSKIREVEGLDYEKKTSHKINDLLSTINLCNTLLSKEFTKFIRENPGFEVMLLDKQVCEKISKRIVEIRSEKNTNENYFRKRLSITKNNSILDMSQMNKQPDGYIIHNTDPIITIDEESFQNYNKNKKKNSQQIQPPENSPIRSQTELDEINEKFKQRLKLTSAQEKKISTTIESHASVPTFATTSINTNRDLISELSGSGMKKIVVNRNLDCELLEYGWKNVKSIHFNEVSGVLKSDRQISSKNKSQFDRVESAKDQSKPTFGSLLGSKFSSVKNFKSKTHQKDLLAIKPINNFALTEEAKVLERMKKKSILKEKKKRASSPVIRYKYDKCVFDKRLHQRKCYFTGISNKEIKFQKSLLNLKTFEKILVIKPENEYNIMRDVKVLSRRYFRTSPDKAVKEKDPPKIDPVKWQKVLEEKRKEKIMNKVINGLSHKAIIEYNNYTNDKKKELENLKNELTGYDSQPIIESKAQRESNTRKVEDSLNRDIAFLNELENLTEKDFINKHNKKKRKSVTSNLLKTKSERKTSENFIRGETIKEIQYIDSD